MGQALPFSDIDLYLKEGTKSGCIVDTNFVIALTEENHAYHEDSQFLYERLVEYQIPLYCTVTVRTEFIDYQRRIKITETLMDMLSPSSKWKISASVREILKKQKGWIDNQSNEEELPCLTDARIKIAKKVFLPRTQSGQVGWVELCKEYLTDKLLNAWLSLEQDLSLNYIDMRDHASQDLFDKELKWENMYRLSEKTALGSNDSMILNVLVSSSLPFVVSADYDLAYGVMQSSADKVILVPDALYKRNLKGLRF
ncbi:MAG: hypothetical protein ACLGGX_12140 [Bdellovibrionia bacterium]